MVRIKICGITNLEDARTALEAGADALGFNFYWRSPRYITPQNARLIIKELPSSLLTVGVFVNEDGPGTAARIAAEAGVTAVQLHGDESPAYCHALAHYSVIKALRVGERFKVEDAIDYQTDAILLDTFSPYARGGTGRRFDWSLARQTRDAVSKLYLAGGLTPENVAEAIAAVQPFAVDVCSGVESAPGRKDAARLCAFVEAARGCAK